MSVLKVLARTQSKGGAPGKTNGAVDPFSFTHNPLPITQYP